MLLRAACQAHGGTALLRAVIRAVLPRQVVSAPALPQLVPALLGPAAMAELDDPRRWAEDAAADAAALAAAAPAEDDRALDALSCYVTYAAQIPETDLVRILRWLLPRARAERLAAAATGGERHGEAGAGAGTAAQNGAIPHADGASGALTAGSAAGPSSRPPARASGASALLSRICACEKSDEQLLLALAAFRPEEAAEMLAQLTGARGSPAGRARWRCGSARCSAEAVAACRPRGWGCCGALAPMPSLGQGAHTRGGSQAPSSPSFPDILTRSSPTNPFPAPLQSSSASMRRGGTWRRRH